jgi:hypothetical protein
MEPRTSTNKRRRTLIATAALLSALALVAGWWLGVRSAGAPDGTDDSPARGGIAAARGASAGSPAASRPPGFQAPAGGDTGRVADQLAKPPSAQLAEALVYPPTSRPLDANRHVDLIRWNRRHEQPRPSRADPNVKVLYTADVFWVNGNQPIQSSLTVTRHGAPVRVKIRRAEAQFQVKRGPALPETLRAPIPLTYSLEGDRHVNTFRPADIGDIDRSVRLKLIVDFDVDGGALQQASIVATYTPTAAAPARFTGVLREAVEEGGLAVYAELEVFTAGLFNVDGNLWDLAGKPVAWARFKGELAVGKHQVRLHYFGKVLRDSGSAGPWRLGELRGIRYDWSRTPAEEMIAPPDTSHFQTAAHAATDFSAEAWKDPLVEERLRRLREEEARLGALARRPDRPQSELPAD